MTDAIASAEPAEVVVLGAGIAGLAAADSLLRAGHRVTVIERGGRCGGTHLSHNIGPYTFDVGSIFYEESSRLFDLGAGLREKCPTVMRRQRRIAPTGKLMHYPLEPREIMRANPWAMPLTLADMGWSRLTTSTDGTLAAITRKRLGRRLFADTGLEAYITRFHHVPPEEIDETFFFQRMGFVARMTELGPLLSNGLRTMFTPRPVNKAVRRPLYIRPQEGFDALFDPVRARLEQAGVVFRFHEPVEAISPQPGGGFVIRTAGGSFKAPVVVCTIPLNAVYRMLFGEETGLASLDLTSLFVSASGLHPDTGNVLFNFHGKGLWKRATIYSRLYPDAPTDRDFFTVEVTVPPGGTPDPHAAFADFAAHVEGLGLARDLRLEGSDLVEDAYPLYRPGAVQLLEAALARVAGSGIITVGRQGRFEYLPTSSGVVHRVQEELASAGLVQEMPA